MMLFFYCDRENVDSGAFCLISLLLSFPFVFGFEPGHLSSNVDFAIQLYNNK